MFLNNSQILFRSSLPIYFATVVNAWNTLNTTPKILKTVVSSINSGARFHWLFVCHILRQVAATKSGKDFATSQFYALYSVLLLLTGRLKFCDLAVDLFNSLLCSSD